jgi:hypothetical protein
VTITAIDTVVAYVVFVTELNRLLPFDVAACHVGRPGEDHVGVTANTAKYNYRHERYSCDVVRAFIKELSHLTQPLPEGYTSTNQTTTVLTVFVGVNVRPSIS